MLDFMTAFPNLAREYVMLALEVMKVPIKIRKRIAALYEGNWHDIVFAGRVYPGFEVQSGVRTGCPMSALLFSFLSETRHHCRCENSSDCATLPFRQ